MKQLIIALFMAVAGQSVSTPSNPPVGAYVAYERNEGQVCIRDSYGYEACISHQPEPKIVPAIQGAPVMGMACNEQSHACMDGLIRPWTCADKARFLLHSEDGNSHICVRFEEK